MSTLIDIETHIEHIINKFSECEIEESGFGYITIWCNPYEEQVWALAEEIKKNVKNIEINIKIANNKDEDYDIIEVREKND